jgi:hypothetical protein
MRLRFSAGLVRAGTIGAAEIIDNLSTDHAVTVTSRRLDVKLQPGQGCVVFSCDRTASRPVATWCIDCHKIVTIKPKKRVDSCGVRGFNTRRLRTRFPAASVVRNEWDG